MFPLALAVLFTTSTQVVLSLAALQFSIPDVQQCQPFSVSFTGDNGQGPTQATTMTILPFNSNPIVVQFPNPSTLRGVLPVSPLFHPAGTRFIASLENGQGEPVTKLSAVSTIAPTNDGSCLVPTSTSPRAFSIPNQVITQCLPFTLNYNTTAIRQPPKVRVYNPRGFSYALNRTSDDPVNGVATFSMNVEGGTDILLLLDGGNGVRETSSLLTVTQDPSNPQGCLARQREVEVAMEAAFKSPQAIASKAVIIGSAAGGGSIVLIAVVMCIFMVRERKRRQRQELNRRSSFDGTRMSRNNDEEKGKPIPPKLTISVAPPTNPQPTFQATDERYLSTPATVDSTTSWVPVVPPSQRPRNPRYESMAPSLAMSESRNVMPQSVDDRERLSLNSLDIEGMLNMATLQTESARKNSATTLFGPDLTSASPPRLRIMTDGTVARRELKVNSDIPDDLQSAYSRDSVNPFITLNDPESADRRRIPSRDLLTRPPPVASMPDSRTNSVGLPVSPRTVQGVQEPSPLSRSDSGSADWYVVGIAR